MIAVPGLWFIAIGIVYLAYKLSEQAEDTSPAFRQRFLDIERDWNSALDNRERRSGFDQIEALKASLQDAKESYEALAADQAGCITRYQNERENRQRTKFLEGFRIRNHKIFGIGPAKLAALTSYGIETAADITAAAVRVVPGFGPINSKPLLEWRKQCERGFIYDPRPTPADHYEIAKIKSENRQQKQLLRQKLSAEAQQFTLAVKTFRSFISQIDPSLNDLHRRRSQIEADLTYLNIPFPPRPTRSAPFKPTIRPGQTATAPRSASTPTAAAGITCPLCGSPMVRRVARRRRRYGKPFWGCSRYPRCHGTRPI